MTVKDFIYELLDYDMDATVDFDIITTEEEYSSSQVEVSGNKQYVTISLTPSDHVLVDKKEYEEMVEELGELRER